MKKFSKKRTASLMDASNALSEGESIDHKDAVDLVIFWRQEHDRVVAEYQHRTFEIFNGLNDLALKTTAFYCYPESK